MNEYDSDFVSQYLINMGYMPIEDPAEADIILINTCTVREKAEHKAYSLMGRISSLKKKRPWIKIGVMGCIAQQEAENLMERFPGLDLVIGPRDIYEFDEIIQRVLEGEKIVSTKLDIIPRIPALRDDFFKGKVKAFISIMQGCNNFCSYCIVPYVRGREVSRPPHEIINEAKFLVSHGIKDITLLGQNVNSYLFNDNGKIIRFSDLIKLLAEIDGLLRLRFTTSHPKDLSDDLIDCFYTLNKLCSHIHLPFQAGSNRILKRMNRNYTREHYMELVRKLREARPDIAITSDVMVGFPGETEEDFQDTLDLIEKVRFDSVFSFKYSDRKGTKASMMPDKINEQEKLKRLKTLQELQKRITLDINKRYEGRIVEVLCEGRSKRGDLWTGRNSQNKIVNFRSDKDELPGNMVKVKILKGYANSLFGEKYYVR